MTWAKLGTEFPDECVEADLSDAAFRTHVEGLMYAYGVEDMALHLRRKVVPRFAGSEHATEAIKELVTKGFWEEQGDGWRIIHHEDVFRASVAAQVKHRESSKAHARKKRGVDGNVDGKLTATTHDVDSNVDSNVDATQTDRQTSIQSSSNSEAGEVRDWSLEISSATTSNELNEIYRQAPGEYRGEIKARGQELGLTPRKPAPAPKVAPSPDEGDALLDNWLNRRTA